MSFEIKDSKGRVLIYCNKKGKLALTRYPDLTQEEIDGMVEVYHELSGDSKEEINNFLTFQSEEKFCS